MSFFFSSKPSELLGMAVALYVFVLLVYMARSPSLRRFIFRSFFLTDPSQKRDAEIEERFHKKVIREATWARLRLTVNEELTRHSAEISELASKTVRDRLETILTEAKDDLKKQNPILMEELARAASDVAKERIDQAQAASLLSRTYLFQSNKFNGERDDRLYKHVEQEIERSARAKAVTTNIFIAFTMVTLVCFMFGWFAPDRATMSFAVIYSSLAAFVVCIYRTSNGRTAMLLSIFEDDKKFRELLHVYECIGFGVELNDAHLKLMDRNRDKSREFRKIHTSSV